MKLIVNPKTKQEEKALKTFLEDHLIDYVKLEEEAAVYQTKKTAKAKHLTKIEKDILHNLDESIDFVNKYKRGKAKAKSLNQLLNEL
jgi:hypothetical protein